MSITFPIQDPRSKQYAQVRIADGVITRRNLVWPNIVEVDGVEVGLPIEGLDPAYTYVEHITTAEPDYDSRLYQLQGLETLDLPNETLTLTWSVLERPLEEQITAVENREAEQFGAIVQKLAREALETRLVVGAIVRFALNNQTFPASVQARMDDYEAKAIRIWNNRQVALDKIQQVTDHAADPQTNPQTDLDADWDS